MYTTIHGLCLTLDLSTSFLEMKIGANQVAWEIGAAYRPRPLFGLHYASRNMLVHADACCMQAQWPSSYTFN